MEPPPVGKTNLERTSGRWTSWTPTAIPSQVRCHHLDSLIGSTMVHSHPQRDILPAEVRLPTGAPTLKPSSLLAFCRKYTGHRCGRPLAVRSIFSANNGLHSGPIRQSGHQRTTGIDRVCRRSRWSQGHQLQAGGGPAFPLQNPVGLALGGSTLGRRHGSSGVWMASEDHDFEEVLGRMLRVAPPWWTPERLDEARSVIAWDADAENDQRLVPIGFAIHGNGR